MDDHNSIFPDPNILWSEIREAECSAPQGRPVMLVVEDDPTTRMVMRHAVRTVVRTDAAGSVADALRMAEAVPYDGLLLALNLPDGNGMEVVTELRDRTPYWGVPMVAVTAQALPEGDGSFLDRGLDAYVSTPVERTALRRLVRHFMVEADGALDKGRRLLHRSDAADRRAEGGRDASQGAPVTEQIEIPGGVDEPPTEEAA